MEHNRLFNRRLKLFYLVTIIKDEGRTKLVLRKIQITRDECKLLVFHYQLIVNYFIKFKRLIQNYFVCNIGEDNNHVKYCRNEN